MNKRPATNKPRQRSFKEIAEEAIREAEEIDCSLEVFLEGLKQIRDLIEERIDVDKP